MRFGRLVARSFIGPCFLCLEILVPFYISLSLRMENTQAARKFDIPYPTFVLYANRVNNMLGPSADGGSGNHLMANGTFTFLN